MKAGRRCKDCLAEGVTTVRDAPHPGPRCATHHRAFRQVAKAASHAQRVAKVYGLPPGAYEALYVAQGGVCAIDQRSTGKTKRLAVDHDHACCPGPTSCGKCVRGLLSGPSNQLIGRYPIEALERALAYLRNPPAHAVLASFVPVDEVEYWIEEGA